MCSVLHCMAYTCIKHILSVSAMRWTFSSSASLCFLFFLDLTYISSELKKKERKKERTLKRPLSITSWAFLVCWSLSKQAIRLLLSPPFKGFYLWLDRNDNIFCWAFRKYEGRKVCVRGVGERHPIPNHATAFLSWKMNLWFEGGFEWQYKKKKKATIEQAVQRW